MAGKTKKTEELQEMAGAAEVTEELQETAEATETAETTKTVKAESDDDFVEIMIEPAEADDSDTVFICVNGDGINVKRGEPVKVKRKFANAWRDAQVQKNSSLKFQKENENKPL